MSLRVISAYIEVDGLVWKVDRVVLPGFLWPKTLDDDSDEDGQDGDVTAPSRPAKPLRGMSVSSPKWIPTTERVAGEWRRAGSIWSSGEVGRAAAAAVHD